MSTEENLEAARHVIAEAFNKGNFAVLRTYFHPDFIEHQFGSEPTIEGMQAKIETLRQAFPDFLLSIDELLAHADMVWMRMTGRGTNLGGFMGPPDGKSFEVTVFDQLRFEDGRIVEHWGSPDRFAVLAQLGKLPSASQPGAASGPDSAIGI